MKVFLSKLSLILLFHLFYYSYSSAQISVSISGIIKENKNKSPLPYANVVLKTEKDSSFVNGTITNEEGRFLINNIKPGNYYLETSILGFKTKMQPLFVGTLSSFLDIKVIELEEMTIALSEVVVKGKPNEISEKMDKKTYSLKDNISQSGGSVLQAMQNLPSVSVENGKLLLRGNDKVAILIDGKQTAITGFGSQSGLDNIPASAIEKIEIINNPSAKYDANGNAGIINIIYKKNKQEGFNGKAGLAAGLGSLWVRRENLPGIRPQYTMTPKINPTLTLNYRKNKVNLFFQGDYLYTETLNKNEFVVRTYDDGEIIKSQLKRNRNTHFTTLKSGIDWNIDENNSITFSGLFGSEKIIDRGDQPFFNEDLSEKLRLWQFLEDELKTTVMATAAYQHKFPEAGRLLNLGFNYTFHREDEKYFYTNTTPAFTSKDAFKLLSDEQVFDFTADYIRPLKYGRIETGAKFRKRNIPTDMLFIPGQYTALDTNAGGWAIYREIIPAIYGNYVFENKEWEAEIGLRIEYVNLQYEVNPDHNTYKSDGYNYTEPFPNARLAYKFDDHNKISFFYNRRVDRPNEVDIRIFPKYDDAEIIKVGNPELRPQFTNSIELGYKTSFESGYFYSALYHRFADATITRISITVPGSNLIYAIFQNIGKSYNTGAEFIFSREISKSFSFNVNANAYYNQIDSFTVINKYPVVNTFSAENQEIFSGSIKINTNFNLPHKTTAQLNLIYLAPDIIPQGKIASRFSIDMGIKKSIQENKGEIFFAATDLFNTMVIRREINGDEFSYTSDDYYETQVIRVGYSYKF